MSDPASERLLLTTRRFRVVEVSQPTRDGGVAPRQVIRHPGAVTVVPLVRPDLVCLISNRRVAVGQELLELPAGTLEPGEPPEQAARRELAEETGYTAGRWTPLTQCYLSPGILDERMHFFLAEQLAAGSPKPEAGEWIENRVVSIDEALEMSRDGRICDAKTLVGLMYLRLFRSVGAS